jgi:ATP-dependent Clp protease ATP-binding subunit ClpC
VSRASEEARTLRHSFVGTEHLLLALLGEDGGTAAGVLKSSGVTYEQVRVAVIRMMGTGVDVDPVAEEPSFTGPAQHVLDRAQQDALSRGEAPAGTEHILLALVAGDDGAAVRILRQLDADPVAIRSALPS